MYLPPINILQDAVFIPENITVHLGYPNDKAENVTLPFIDYIKNVASSELYPTWPENAIRANVYAIVSIALNRIFTNWYRGRGYDFDITNTTQFDQAFIQGRGNFENINKIVDELYDEYIGYENRLEPLFATFCDGRQSQCDGMYQWGSIDLAKEGYTPLEILQYYYGNNITIKTAPINESVYRYRGNPLKLGDSSILVLIKQIQLNRISLNFPAIPKIIPTEGYFDIKTENSVKKFQEVFKLPVTGEIDKNTWNKIYNIYTAVLKLGERTSEGVALEEFEKILRDIILLGDVRSTIPLLQFMLDLLSNYYNSIPKVNITGVFDEQTRNSVIEFQKLFGLPPTGIVERNTWEALFNETSNIIKNAPPGSILIPYLQFPGINIGLGIEGLAVFAIQHMLQYISTFNNNIPPVQLTQVYDQDTQNAIFAFQQSLNLPPTGVVDETTWNSLVNLYQSQRNA